MFARVPNPGKQSIRRQRPPSARKQSTNKPPNFPGFAMYLPPNLFLREIGAMWPIGVITGKPCIFLVQNGSFSAFWHCKNKERLSMGSDVKWHVPSACFGASRQVAMGNLWPKCPAIWVATSRDLVVNLCFRINFGLKELRALGSLFSQGKGIAFVCVCVCVSQCVFVPVWLVLTPVWGCNFGCFDLCHIDLHFQHEQLHAWEIWLWHLF